MHKVMTFVKNREIPTKRNEELRCGGSSFVLGKKGSLCGEKSPKRRPQAVLD